MENQDIDLIGQTVGNMPYKIGIVDQNGNLKNQFVANASTNRIDIPQSILGNGGGSTGGNTGGSTGGNTGGTAGGGTAGGNTGGGTAQSQVAQLPSTKNLFSGSAVGDILLAGPTPNYDNVQDGLLLTLSNQTLGVQDGVNEVRMDLSPSGLKGIKIPKEKLVVNSFFDISDQLSQYIGKNVQEQFVGVNGWQSEGSDDFIIVSFGGTAIQVLPNTTLSMNLIVSVKVDSKHSTYDTTSYDGLKIPVIRVNTYKN